VASAQAQIEIAIKNVRALDNLSRKLNQLILVNKKLVTSINKLDTTFKNISKSGLGELERGSKKASKEVLTTTDTIKQLQGGVKGLQREVAVPLDLIANRFKTIGKGITLQPIKGLVDEISKIPYVVKRGVQDWGSFFEILNKGKKDIISTVAGLGALIANVKNFGVTARTNLTSLGTILDNNATKAENFLNKMVLGIKMQNTAFALAKNTALAQQKSLPGTLLRNTLRSQAGRAGTGFGDFSQGMGEYNPYQIATPTPRYGAGRIGPIHPTQHYALQSNPYMGQFDNATQKSIARHTKHLAKINKHTGKTAALLANQQAMAGLNQYGTAIGPIPPTLGQRAGVMANTLGFGKNANPQGVFASRGGIGGRIRGGISSGMIGGAFPFLFGQGGAASAGGALGGLAGGALGGGLGFGLSLLGTVAGSKIQEAADFRKEIDKLNTAIKGTGGTSVFTAEKIKELAKKLGVTKEEALQAAGSFEQFGAAARVTLLQAFPNEETFNYFSNIKNNQSLLDGMLDMQKKIGFEQSQIALEVLRTQGFRAAELFLLDKTLEKQKQARIDAAKEKNSKIGGGELLGDLGSMLQQIDEANINKEFEDMKKEAQDLINKTKEWNRELEKTMMVSQIKDELIKLQDPMFQIVEAANAIGDAFSSSFKGIISGSMSAQEALANLFKRTADHFVDMAAEILAAQIRAKIVGMFANAFAGGIGTAQTGIPSGANLPAGSFGTGTAGGVGKTANDLTRHFASGGYVTRPTVGLVGEAGEDEYVIPASKMASSMQRYSAGARGDSVIAGSGSSYAGGGAGGSTTVNYSGPILNFNSEEFVPKSAVGQIIASAAKQGASMGETRTMKSMQNNRSARARIGM
jgi:hypothetical protein